MTTPAQFPPPPPPGPPPTRPRPPDLRRTSHGLHLALTLVIGVLTLGVGLVVWPIVWLIVHMVNASNNTNEQVRFDRETAWYQHVYRQWQEAHYAAYGRYAPEQPY